MHLLMATKELQQQYLCTFLKKNEILLIGDKYRISNTTLATLTILVASSNPNDKESIINLIKVILFG